MVLGEAIIKINGNIGFDSHYKIQCL